MILDGWNVQWIKKDKKRGIYYSIVEPVGFKNSFPETRNWKYVTDWTLESMDVDNFAVIHHSTIMIRKKYPYLYLLESVYKWPSKSNVPEFANVDFPKIEADIRFGPSYHEGIIKWHDKYNSLIVSFGRDGDYLPYAKRIWSHWSQNWIIFLLSKEPVSLLDIKKSLESARNPKGYEEMLLKHAGIALFMNYGEGWVDLITRDEEIIDAFQKNKKIESKKMILIQYEYHIVEKRNWLKNNGIQFMPEDIPKPKTRSLKKLIDKIKIDGDITKWDKLNLKGDQYDELMWYLVDLFRLYDNKITQLREKQLIHSEQEGWSKAEGPAQESKGGN